MGADRAIHVRPTWNCNLAVAKLLKAVCDKEQPQLVILGKQAITATTATRPEQMLAALAGWAQGTFASGSKSCRRRI